MQLTATTSPEKLGFSADRLQRITARLQGYIDNGELSGLIATVARRGEYVYVQLNK